MANLTITTKTQTYTIPEGKPAIVKWKSKNKERPGISTAIAWIKRGEKPHTFLLIHSCFQTYDKVEQEYPASWTIWESQILDIHQVAALAK